MSQQNHTVVKGNTADVVMFKLRTPGGQPISLSGAFAVKVVGEKDNSDVWIAETDTGISSEPTFTFTAAASDDNKLRHNGTKLEQGDQIEVSTTTTLPTGLAASTRYFVRDLEPNAWKVSLSPDGPVVSITGAGSGTHSYKIIGSVSYTWLAANVSAVGTFWLWVNRYTSSGVYTTYPTVTQPQDRGFKVTVVEIA